MTNVANEQSGGDNTGIAPRSAAMILNGVLGLTTVKILMAFGLFPVACVVLATVIAAMLVLYSGTDKQAQPFMTFFGPIIGMIDRSLGRLKGSRSVG